VLDRDIVVPKVEPLTADEFHSTFSIALHRMMRTHGRGRVALWLGVSDRQLRNIEAGSLPTADKIWNLLAYDQSAHDELDAEFGLRNVEPDMDGSAEAIAIDLIGLAHETAIHEADPSASDHKLLTKDENRLRRVARWIGGRLNRIREIRRPRRAA